MLTILLVLLIISIVLNVVSTIVCVFTMRESYQSRMYGEYMARLGEAIFSAIIKIAYQDKYPEFKEVLDIVAREEAKSKDDPTRYKTVKPEAVK